MSWKRYRAPSSDADALAAELHREVHAGVLGPGLQPWGTVEEQAQVHLDFVLEGGYHARPPSIEKEPQLHDAWLAREAGLGRFAYRERVRQLLRIALRLYALMYPRAKVRWSGWTQHGVTFERSGGEKHVHCIYCREDLATLDRGSHRLSLDWIVHRLSLDWIVRREQHTIPCALRGLIDSDHWRGPIVARRKVR